MCSHVLEHVSYPIHIIELLLSLMNAKTFLYIEVPYQNYWKQSFIKRWQHYLRKPQLLFSRTAQPIFIHEHITMFRKKTFQVMFPSSTFTILYLEEESDIISCLIQKRIDE